MTPVRPDCRHCAQCHKNIVDFTFKSDAEILRHLQQNEGRICGRFRPDQLQRPLHSANKIGWGVRAFATGLLGLFALPAWSQQQDPIQMNQPINNPTIISVSQDTIIRTISGKIIDPQTGEPIIGAVVQFRNFGTITNLDGVFSLRVPLSTLYPMNEPLKVHFTGFMPLELPLPEKILQEDLALLPQPMEESNALLGEIILVSPKKPGDRIRCFFRKIFH
jgi:hypothetical protein